jgi:CRP-like cAMP-binding protein
MSQIAQFLTTTQMFQNLSSPQYEALSQIAQIQFYEKGQAVFWQGEEGRGFFIVKQGKVKVFQLSPAGKEQILRFFTTGEHFAEVPAFDGGCFPASAVAVEKTELLFFARKVFLQLLEEDPKLAINILAIFAQHLRQFANLIETLSLKEVPSRLAAYLLTLSERQGNKDTIELDINKGQLAAVIGTIPETLSRALTKLTQENLIKVDGLQITLLDKEKLKQRAGFFDDFT